MTYLGKAGVDTLAAIMGVSDVDPFIMGLTQAAGTLTPLKVAAGAILIAAASNNVVKGIYAYSLADRKTGRQSLAFLVGLALPAWFRSSGSCSGGVVKSSSSAAACGRKGSVLNRAGVGKPCYAIRV